MDILVFYLILGENSSLLPLGVDSGLAFCECPLSDWETHPKAMGSFNYFYFAVFSYHENCITEFSPAFSLWEKCFCGTGT